MVYAQVKPSALRVLRLRCLVILSLIALAPLSACGSAAGGPADTTGPLVMADTPTVSASSTRVAPTLTASPTPPPAAPASPTRAAPTLTASPTPPPAATALSADVLLTEGQGEVTVRVGQVLGVPAAPEFTWAVSYSRRVLLALTPPDQMGSPGPGGWLFRVIAPGSAEIVLESVAPPCPGTTPCPPNVMRMVYPITAVP